MPSLKFTLAKERFADNGLRQNEFGILFQRSRSHYRSPTWGLPGD